MKRLISIGLILGFVVLLVLPSMAAEEDGSRKVLREGMLGAVTGAVAADQSGGKAGKGALIGAGTNVIGGAILDTVMGPSQQSAPAPAPQQAPVYVTQAQPTPVYVVPAQPAPNDAQGWYQKGYQDGFKAGYQEGLNARRVR